MLRLYFYAASLGSVSKRAKIHRLEAAKRLWAASHRHPSHSVTMSLRLRHKKKGAIKFATGSLFKKGEIQ